MSKILNKKKNFSTETHKKDIIKLYEEGNSIIKIAKSYRVPPSTISRGLKRWKVKRREVDDQRRTYTLNKYYFDEIDSEDKAYFLGLLYADGCNIKSGRSQQITLGLEESDVYILELFKKKIEYSGPLYFSKGVEFKINDKTYTRRNQFKLCISSSYLCKSLLEKGMVHRKSIDLCFPNFIKKEFISHFLRGFLDGDGCIYIPKNKEKEKETMVTFYTTEKFCIALKDFLKEMGISSNIFVCSHKKMSMLYISYIYNTYKLLSYIYKDSTVYLPRKYNKFQELKYIYQNMTIASSDNVVNEDDTSY